MKIRRFFLPLMILAIVCCSTVSIAQQNSRNVETRPIVSAASETLIFDTQDPPTIFEDKVVQSGDYAIVGWINGPLGGTILMKRTGQTWSKVAGDGGPIGLHHETLMELGVPQATALDLSQKFRTVFD